jgi:hypothetical protein
MEAAAVPPNSRNAGAVKALLSRRCDSFRVSSTALREIQIREELVSVDGKISD